MQETRAASTVWLVLCVVAISASPLAAEAVTATNVVHAYQDAKSAYEAAPSSIEAAWKFGRACFDAAEAATNKTQRAQVAEEGIAACRKALAVETNSAALHYYLALNLGELAQTRGFSALKLVSQMEEELLQAVELDAAYDNAGPERTLGMLYRDAPAIASVGNRTKARQHLLRAVQLAPAFPENQLELIESLLKWNDRNAARRQLVQLEQDWPTAKSKLTGETWAADWTRWEEQLQKLKKQLGEPAKLQSPRH